MAVSNHPEKEREREPTDRSSENNRENEDAIKNVNIHDIEQNVSYEQNQHNNRQLSHNIQQEIVYSQLPHHNNSQNSQSPYNHHIHQQMQSLSAPAYPPQASQ